MTRSVAFLALTLIPSVVFPQTEAQLRERAIRERHAPKDSRAEFDAAIARFVSRDGTKLTALEAAPLSSGIRESAKPPHPVSYMWMHELIRETIPQSNGYAISETARPRGVAVISSIEGRMTVETYLSESEIRARPRRVYEVLPSRLCPQVLATFDVRGESHTPDKAEQDATAARDARFPELQQTARAGAQRVAPAVVDDSALAADPALQRIHHSLGVRFGEELPALTEQETQAAAAILRSPSSYIEGMSGCIIEPVIALKFPSREKLTVLVCFRCRQLQFFRGMENLGGGDLNGPAAQALFDIVRRVMPSLPERLPH